MGYACILIVICLLSSLLATITSLSGLERRRPIESRVETLDRFHLLLWFLLQRSCSRSTDAETATGRWLARHNRCFQLQEKSQVWLRDCRSPNTCAWLKARTREVKRLHQANLLYQHYCDEVACIAKSSKVRLTSPDNQSVLLLLRWMLSFELTHWPCLPRAWQLCWLQS